MDNICWLTFVVDVFIMQHLRLILQRLNAGDEPSTAFVLSSDAALAGAESTKNMQAQVTISTILLFSLAIFVVFRKGCNFDFKLENYF